MNRESEDPLSATVLAALYLSESTNFVTRSRIAWELFLPEPLKALDPDTLIRLHCHPDTPVKAWNNLAPFTAEPLAIRYLEEYLSDDERSSVARVLFTEETLSQLTDETLARLYTHPATTTLANLDAIQKKLLDRRYQQIDAEIRAVLGYRGWAYGARDEYYNEVFLPIYKAIFERAHLNQHLRRFDPDKASFEYYFFKVLVRRRALDWLKGKEEELYLREILIPADAEELDEETEPGTGPGGPSPPVMDQPPAEEQERIRAAIKCLKPASQVVLYLRSLVYAFPPKRVIGYMAEEVALRTSENKDAAYQRLRKELLILRDKLRASPEFAAEAQREEELALLQANERRYKFQAEELRHKLRGEGVSEARLHQAEVEAINSQYGTLQEEYRHLTLQSRLNTYGKWVKRAEKVQAPPAQQALQKHVNRLEQQLHRAGLNATDPERIQAEAQSLSEDELYRRGTELNQAMLLNRFQEASKRFVETKHKRQKKVDEMRESKRGVAASHRQIAAILRIPVGTVGSRLTEARREFEECLDREYPSWRARQRTQGEKDAVEA